MNLMNLVCTLPQSIALDKAGITYPQAPLVWISVSGRTGLPQGSYDVQYNLNGMWTGELPAFTASELGAMLLKQTANCYYHNPSSSWSHDNAGRYGGPRGAELFTTITNCFADRLLYLMQVDPVKFSPEFFNMRLQRFLSWAPDEFIYTHP